MESSSPVNIPSTADEPNRIRVNSLDEVKPLDVEEETELKTKCKIGVCCMDIKGKSKSMQHIVKRLSMYNDFEIISFGEQTILEKDIEEWPVVDCLISFFSQGFPMEKAIAYRQLHPTTFCLNELSWQKVLLDRRMVYKILKKNSIPMVKHLIMSRDGFEEEPTFFESRNFIEVNGKRMMKPFVEKPISAEDHNINIYYHSNKGGGSTRLFRKIGNKSSEKYPNIDTVRRDGSYIYEEFIQTEGFQDIKVYTIGEDYAHAESRKAPVVDGIVLRGTDGKEIRQVIQLTEEEKNIARKVVRAFKQQICGFDLLRSNGQSYVCDVNGWSFVKGNQKYYDDFARITRSLFIDAMIDKGLPFVTVQRGVRVLRGVAAVFRHADRTPKQKVKLHIRNADILNFFDDNNPEEVRLKNDSESDNSKLKELLDISQDILNKKKEGIDPNDAPKLLLLCTVIQRGFGGTKIQIKPSKFDSPSMGAKRRLVSEALIVCKWGGVLTHAGIEQSRLLGKNFMERVFPKESREEFLKSVEVFSNNERRVKRTAEEFAAGLLNVTEVPHHLVCDNKETAQILGNIAAGKLLMNLAKEKIHEVMHLQDASAFNHLAGIEDIESPLATMKEIQAHLKELYRELPSSAELCEGETVPMMQQRYQRLTANFFNSKKNTFDTTKIPDIFDYITYDILHNHNVLNHHDLSQLYEKTELLARFIVPNEYGLYDEEKLAIGSLICEDLTKKLYNDMVEMSKTNGSKTRLYFTSESHMHTLRNILLNSNTSEFHELIEPIELSYLSHIVFKIYENLGSQNDDSERWQIEVLFSSGTHNNPFGVINNEHRQAVRPMVSVNDHLSLDEFKNIIELVDSVVRKYHLEHPEN